MNIDDLKKEIKVLVSHSKIDEALERIKAWLNLESSASNQFILIKYKFEKFKQEKGKKTISSEESEIRENLIVNNLIQFLESLSESDLLSENEATLSPKNIKTYRASGKFEELRIPQLKDDFKSIHLIPNFDYSGIDTFRGDMYDIIVTREDNRIIFAGEQNVTFRKKANEEAGKIVKENIFGQGKIEGEYAYLDYFTKQIDGIIIRSGKLIFNISDNQQIYGYFMTPDIELSGIIAVGRMELKIHSTLE